MVNWYKEERTKEERREIYRKLREAGLNSYWSRRLRDWSIPKIKLFLENNGYDVSMFNGGGNENQTSTSNKEAG